MLSPGLHVAMIALPATIFLISVCALIIAISSPNRGMALAHAGPPKPWSDPYYSSEQFEDGSASSSTSFSNRTDRITWIAPYSTLDPPVPLLHLALQRMAVTASSSSSSSSGKTKKIHVQRPENLRILETWQESTGNVEVDANPSVDRWYRWIVVACFYGVDDTHGECETLDVRAKTAWNSGVPPTRWPVEAKSLGPENPGGAPPSTSDLMLITGTPEGGRRLASVAPASASATSM